MKKKTLGELLKPANDYERLVADHVRGRHDAALEAAIVEHQRSIGGCLRYIGSCASKKRRPGATCVMMSDEEVFGLAVHWFLDGDTDSGTSPGAPLSASPAPSSDKPAKSAKPAMAAAADALDRAAAIARAMLDHTRRSVQSGEATSAALLAETTAPRLRAAATRLRRMPAKPKGEPESPKSIAPRSPAP